ncbi:hypothetical protein LSAT2_004845, partial [Lamellibrachia satsuma]
AALRVPPLCADFGSLALRVPPLCADFVNQEDNSAFTETGLISKDPYVNFRHWFDQACQSKSVIEPNAVSVATANK